jgi:Flp pilus assembly protein TadD
MRSSVRVAARLLRSSAVITVLALPAAGCQTAGFGEFGAGSAGLFGARTASTPTPTSGQNDWQREAQAAGEAYRANPSDPKASLRFAQALRRTGQRAQASAVLQQASIRHPRDSAILGAYGRALADNGHFAEALDMLSRAHTPEQPDWRVLSAQGAVLDQMGRHAEARRYYLTALKIAPEEPSVLSNLGLSYVLAKELPQAETTLRRANATGSVDRRVRQNLALVVGLQGRFKEAEDIASTDLPPDQAAENVAYLKDMIARQQLAAKPNAKTRSAGKPLRQAELRDSE